MPGIRKSNRYLKPAFLCLLVSALFTSTAALADDEEPGFFERLFGSRAEVARADAGNIAWKSTLPAGFYDGDYNTCVAVSGSQRLAVESAVIVHFGRTAKITGAAVYVRRLSEEGDVSGEFLKEGYFWDSSLGEVSQLGTNTTGRVSPGSPTKTSDLKFVITEISGPAANVCLTELDVYGSLIDEEEEPIRKSGLEGNWVVEYSDADNVKGKTLFGYYSMWPGENATTTGLWNYSVCSVPGSSGCGEGQIPVSPEGKVRHQHGYGFMGLWGGFSTVKQVGPDELRGRWTYQDAYGGAEVWRRVRPQVSRVVLSSDVSVDFDPRKRPGRVEKTYDGYWWGPTVTARANRPKFNITIYGNNLWGRHDIRISPRLDTDNLVLSDLELGCCGNVFGTGREIVGLGMEVLAWAGAVPGRKILYVDDIAIPFDFIIHGHPQEDEVVWPDDATKPREENYKLAFLVESTSGFVAAEGMRVKEGDFFIVEVSFEEPPEETPVVVDLEWDGAVGGFSLALNRFAGSSTIYRSDPLVMDSEGSVTYGVTN